MVAQIFTKGFVLRLSLQLLDLMHTLHTRAATIFSSWAEEERERQRNAEPREPYLEGQPGIDAGTSTLWTKCWCPLLQGELPGEILLFLIDSFWSEEVLGKFVQKCSVKSKNKLSFDLSCQVQFCATTMLLGFRYSRGR